MGFLLCQLGVLSFMLSAAPTDSHGFQVGVIGNLVHSSPNIKKEVLLAGALQPVIGLLRYLFVIFLHSIWS